MLINHQTAKRSAILPTGHVIDQFDCSFGKVDATFCDVGNPIVFVEAEKLGARGSETPADLDANKGLIARIKEVRGRTAQLWGKCKDWTKVDEQSPMLPMVALVSKPTSSEYDIQARLFLDNHCHPSMAGTGGICDTTVSRIKGSVVNRLVSQGTLESDTFKIQHPEGYLPVKVRSTYKNGDELPTFTLLSFVRTARYIMQGQLFIPADIQDLVVKPQQPASERAKAAGQAQDEQATDRPAQDFKTGTPPAKSVKVTEALVNFTHEAKFEDLPADV